LKWAGIPWMYLLLCAVERMPIHNLAA